MPIGIVGGLAIVIATYTLINAAYVRVLSISEIAESPAVAALLAERVLGGAGARFIATLVLISAPGVVNVLMLAGSRLYFAMAEDGLFFEAATRLHPRYKSPTWSIVAQAGWSSVLLISSTYGHLLKDAMFAEWTFFALIGGFGVRVREPRSRLLCGAGRAPADQRVRRGLHPDRHGSGPQHGLPITAAVVVRRSADSRRPARVSALDARARDPSSTSGQDLGSPQGMRVIDLHAHTSPQGPGLV